jgi:hypothetical protein
MIMCSSRRQAFAGARRRALRARRGGRGTIEIGKPGRNGMMKRGEKLETEKGKRNAGRRIARRSVKTRSGTGSTKKRNIARGP